ncbi:MAG: TIGR01212 family radical SAM protein [Lachnospira sp.]|nr:TIGR01212 family radical SAM protein [Lachnospira sp.]
MKPYYYSLNEYLKEQYGHKIYKLALNGGMTCPNRDGLIDFRGCIFCSAGGSGDFATGLCDFDKAKELIKDKYSGNDFIAYFQSFTNTYAPVSYLEQLYMPIIKRDDVRILSIATRPDCLSDECIELLDKLNKIKPVWIELGLQTIHERTARYIRRGYSLDVFENAVSRLNKIGIRPIVHMIIGLPGESHDEILQTAAYLSHMNISGIKLQLLHVLKNTDLATDYNNGCFKVLELDEYISIVADILQILPADMIIHRITGDGPKNLLIAPLWSANKKNVLNSLNRYLRDNNIIQGSKFNLINNKEE